ncbi:MAG: FixH family protein [Sphingobacteriales bacterium]|jgi:hypothetical protein|nr:FixH family protein [Sphingobacteriales bacterium]MBP9140178.1 FixH family protein [Chitinophagales bacterium]MDA0197688.1 FixH family protein [Bacteroidota bacterium]MBK6888953.1 FixH family protein [Sphingobacteriales bacterium]MBK7528545.1 FixH family protein [Sphingobacteriales bacterium]
MNWGYRIILVYILFISGVFTAIYVAFNQEIDLVSTDYYAQELKFQNVIDGKNNLASLPTPVKIVENETAFELQLPNEFTGKNIKGEAWFYYPTNAKLDKKFDLAALSNNTISINRQQIAKGNGIIKLQFVADDVPYYYEQQFKN